MRPCRRRGSQSSSSSSAESFKSIENGDNCTNVSKEVEEGTTWASPVIKNETEHCLSTKIHYNSSKKDEEFVNFKCLSPAHRSRDSFPVFEVPTWREYIFTKSSDGSGTEDLDDPVFCKRHHKFELDERRRKRWDTQRLREEEILAKRKARTRLRDKAKAKAKTPKKSVGKAESVVNALEAAINEFDTFQPKVELATSIRVADDIPASVFGYPMPIMEKSVFELPWDLKPRRPKRKRNEVYYKIMFPIRHIPEPRLNHHSSKIHRLRHPKFSK